MIHWDSENWSEAFSSNILSGGGQDRNARTVPQCKVGFTAGRASFSSWAVRPSEEKALGQGVGVEGLGRSQVDSGFPPQPLHSKNSSSSLLSSRAALQRAGRAAVLHISSADV